MYIRTVSFGDLGTIVRHLDEVQARVKIDDCTHQFESTSANRASQVERQEP